MVGEILIDDTDSGIQYSGSWTQETNTQRNLGNNGVPYQNSLHRTDGTANFSYTFRGSNFLIYGTIESVPLVPTWQCFLDGSSIPTTGARYTGTDNRIQFCDGNGLVEGSHSIAVNVAVPSGGPSFLFDYLQYIPFDDVSLDDATVEVEFEVPNPQIKFATTGQWSQVFPGYLTSQQGSTFTYNFTGVSVTWLGFYNNTFPIAATTATYSIDGETPTSFALDGSIGQNTNGQFRQIFFNSSQLPAGPHVLVVAYQGTAETTPLTISSLIIQNGTNPGPKPTISQTTTPTTNSGFNSTTSHHFSEIGLAVGCSIGALFALFLVLGCLWFRRRKALNMAKIPQPYIHPDTSNEEPSRLCSASQADISTPPERDIDSGLRFSPVGQVQGAVGALLPPAYSPSWTSGSWRSGGSITSASDTGNREQIVNSGLRHIHGQTSGTGPGNLASTTNSVPFSASSSTDRRPLPAVPAPPTDVKAGI